MSIQIGSSSSFPLNQLPEAAVNKLGRSDPKGFQQLLGTMLKPDSSGNVNEEQLYSAVINERLTTLAGADAAGRYQALLGEMQNSMQRADGFVPVEKAADAALEQLVAEGVISKDQADTVTKQSFGAAQLDNNHDLLYDSLGTTSAVAAINSAIISASAVLEGKAPVGVASNAQDVGGKVNEPSGKFIGGDGFLFKPVSESNGNLVVLLPSHMQQDADSVQLVDSSTGNTIEKGQSYGAYEDGRPIFRFNRPGRSYPENMIVQVRFDSGDVKEYSIPDPANRWE